MCPVFRCFRSWGWSPHRHGWSWLLPSPCQHLSDKGKSKISVWDFLPTTWRKRYVTVDNGQVQQVEKELFCSLPCSTAGRVATGHPICIINMPHVTVIIRHNCRLYCVPVFIAIIAFYGWIVFILRLLWCVTLSSPLSESITTSRIWFGDSRRTWAHFTHENSRCIANKFRTTTA